MGHLYLYNLQNQGEVVPAVGALSSRYQTQRTNSTDFCPSSSSALEFIPYKLLLHLELSVSSSTLSQPRTPPPPRAAAQNTHNRQQEILRGLAQLRQKQRELEADLNPLLKHPDNEGCGTPPAVKDQCPRQKQGYVRGPGPLARVVWAPGGFLLCPEKPKASASDLWRGAGPGVEAGSGAAGGRSPAAAAGCEEVQTVTGLVHVVGAVVAEVEQDLGCSLWLLPW
ncbi:hypothetical protein INR49_001686 [Caranx melampygus]|nr:hypothetical protein INR49_001686 [Caranx melampygus]